MVGAKVPGDSQLPPSRNIYPFKGRLIRITSTSRLFLRAFHVLKLRNSVVNMLLSRFAFVFGVVFAPLRLFVRGSVLAGGVRGVLKLYSAKRIRFEVCLVDLW